MYDLRILVNGRPIRKYHDRDGKIWIEGREGTPFQVKVSNDTWNRVLAVVSVDGVNVIDGKHRAPKDSRGYILNTRSGITIPGWKVSQDEVKEFYFTANGVGSYAKKIGADERNIGVIATAIFKEKKNYVTYTWPPYRDCYPCCDHGWHPHTYTTTTKNDDFMYIKPTSFSSSNEEVTVRSMSTPTVNYANRESVVSSSDMIACNFTDSPQVSVGSGERREFTTHKSDFDRDEIIEMITIYYDTYEGLKRRGIIDCDRSYKKMPQAFPGSGDYCPDM